jgi:hypothetical protein
MLPVVDPAQSVHEFPPTSRSDVVYTGPALQEIVARRSSNWTLLGDDCRFGMEVVETISLGNMIQHNRNVKVVLALH